MKTKHDKAKGVLNNKAAAIKVSPLKLARIIAECACQELAAQQTSSSMSADETGLKLPDAPREANTPSQASVDAGLFPGMGDSPALSDSGGNGGCGDSDVPEKPPIHHVEQPASNNNMNNLDDDAKSVELVIGSI